MRSRVWHSSHAQRLMKRSGSILGWAVVALTLTACAGRGQQPDASVDGESSNQGEAQGSDAATTVNDEIVTLAVEWDASAGSHSRESVNLVSAVTADTLFTAGDKGRINAFNAIDGESIWRVDLDESISAGITVASGRALVVTAAGKLLALDVTSGEQIWAHSVFSEVLAAPRVDSNVVVVRGVDGKVIGVNLDTGERLWAYQRDVPALSLRGSSSPLVHAGVAVTGFASGRVIANQVDDGQILWELPIAEARGRNELERLIDIDSEPVLNGSVLYVAVYHGELTALALGSRRMLWQKPISSHRNIAVDTNHVYVTDEENVVHAVDRLSGDPVWQQDSLSSRALNGPVLLDGELVVGDADGDVHVLDAVSGRVLTTLSVAKDPLLRGIQVKGDTAFALARSGKIYAVKLTREAAVN